MKTMQIIKTVAVASGFLLNLTPMRAGEVIINDFDTADETTPYTWENWSAPTDVAFDALNAGGGQSGLAPIMWTGDV